MQDVGGTLLALRLRSFNRLYWLLFFAGGLACWLVIFFMAVPAELRAIESNYGASIIELLCGGELGVSKPEYAFAMWALMSAAMMAPTAVPAFATYDDLSDVAQTGFAKLVGGYLAVWVVFSALAAAMQVGLFRQGLIGSLGQSHFVPLTMALLVGAGLYQFSPLKEACLTRCRAPLTFFMQHWEDGPFRNGLRLGLDCVGCCWALMLLAFIGGTMNLWFMGLAMLLMTLEKLPDIGRWLTKPLGAILIVSGLTLPIL